MRGAANALASLNRWRAPVGLRNHWFASPLAPRHNHSWSKTMNTLAISLAVGASALFMTAASAAPLSADVSVVPESNIQTVRMVCDENGRCWRERSERRVIIRERDDAYAYAPRERYIERRGYDDRGGGVGIQVPGVSVGIGTGRY
jgi:hypothetical protein